MYVLGLKVLVPLLVSAAAVYSEWSTERKKKQRRRTKLLTAAYVIVAAASVAGLVYDHVDQAARTAAAEEEAERARQGRQQAERDAAAARLERQNIAGSVQQVVDYMLELDPSLTEQQALDRLVAEFHDLRELSADLEDQLAGLRRYSDVAELNALGDPELVGPGSGLRYSNALTRALEGAWGDRDGRYYPRCDQTSLAKFSAAVESRPTFPFAHYALSECAFEAGDDTWRQHAERAVEILRYTTQFAGITRIMTRFIESCEAAWKSRAREAGLHWQHPYQTPRGGPHKTQTRTLPPWLPAVRWLGLRAGMGIDEPVTVTARIPGAARTALHSFPMERRHVASFYERAVPGSSGKTRKENHDPQEMDRRRGGALGRNRG